MHGCVEVPGLHMLGDEALLSEEVESQPLLWVSNVRVNFLLFLCREKKGEKGRRGRIRREGGKRRREEKKRGEGERERR